MTSKAQAGSISAEFKRSEMPGVHSALSSRAQWKGPIASTVVFFEEIM